MLHRRPKLAPYITEKHYTNFSPTNIAAAGISVSSVAIAVAVVDKNSSNEVEEGDLVKAVFIERWLTSDDATQSSFVLSVEKLPGNQPTMTFAQSIAMNTYPNKKNILYVTEGLVSPVAQNPTPVIRQWIGIPKGKQRMGLGDRILVNIAAIANGITFCGFNVFKEVK